MGTATLIVPRASEDHRQTDATLARRVAEGDQRAFEVIFTRFRDDLVRYAFGITRNLEDAEEAVQTAMLRAHDRLAQRHVEGVALGPWLFRVTHNAAVSIVRSRRLVSPAEEDIAAPETATPVASLERRERVEGLLRDIAALPERHRKALLMRGLGGASPAMIASTLSVSPPEARRLVHEARAALVEAEAGREVACERVRDLLLHGDRRRARGRRVTAHLVACEPCARLARERRAARTMPAMGRPRLGVAGAGQSLLVMLLVALAATAAVGTVLLSRVLGGGGGGDLPSFMVPDRGPHASPAGERMVMGFPALRAGGGLVGRPLPGAAGAFTGSALFGMATPPAVARRDATVPQGAVQNSTAPVAADAPAPGEGQSPGEEPGASVSQGAPSPSAASAAGGNPPGGEEHTAQPPVPRAPHAAATAPSTPAMGAGGTHAVTPRPRVVATPVPTVEPMTPRVAEPTATDTLPVVVDPRPEAPPSPAQAQAPTPRRGPAAPADGSNAAPAPMLTGRGAAGAPGRVAAENPDGVTPSVRVVRGRGATGSSARAAAGNREPTGATAARTRGRADVAAGTGGRNGAQAVVASDPASTAVRGRGAPGPRPGVAAGMLGSASGSPAPLSSGAGSPAGTPLRPRSAAASGAGPDATAPQQADAGRRGPAEPAAPRAVTVTPPGRQGGVVVDDPVTPAGSSPRGSQVVARDASPAADESGVQGAGARAVSLDAGGAAPATAPDPGTAPRSSAVGRSGPASTVQRPSPAPAGPSAAPDRPADPVSSAAGGGDPSSRTVPTSPQPDGQSAAPAAGETVTDTP